MLLHNVDKRYMVIIMKTKLLCYIVFVFVTLLSTSLWGFEALSDEKLSTISAGGAGPNLGSKSALTQIPFSYSSRHGSVDGEVIVLPTSTSYEFSSLHLSDNAQSNLNSLININAVNSPINVLLNLNVNVNSHIEKINQLNTLFSN